jgi:flagellar biosynthesis protein FlhA
MNAIGVINQIKSVSRNGIGTPVLLSATLAMMVVPLPPLMLDLLFTFNISLALVVLLVAVYTRRPLDFTVFPTVLLVATLLRLALNVASTRVVLLGGHAGTAAAGQVIQAFGEFVVGGNYAVGLVVFVILVLINFVVVTKGAGRISEVTARFTLDAMPGKQMAIDADLNAGLITQEEARNRREEISREADFYGAMDGASKFVRGDAVAGILILLINILGGLSVGILQHDLTLSEAVHNYSLLTIGDGLVAQIPSLVLSTSAAIIVTRVSAAEDMGEQVLEQLFSSPRALMVTAGVVGTLGLVPGMPNFVFLLLASLFGGASYMALRRQNESDTEDPPEQTVDPDRESAELSWDDVGSVDIVGLEVGYRLIPMVDKSQGGQLMPRIKGVRKKLSQELGFLIQSVHIRDNLDLAPNAYRMTLMGVPVAEAEIHADRELAINPGKVFGALQGIATKDPSFGLDAVWIESDDHEQAQTMGYTVVDASTVVATHLSQILQQHAHELIGHEEVQHLLDVLAKNSPKLVENLVPKTLALSVVVKVLQNLLRERIPIRDMRTIAETLAEYAPKCQDPDELSALSRVALSRTIVQKINGIASELQVFTLDASMEQILLKSRQGNPGAGPIIEPGLAEQLQKSVSELVNRLELEGRPAVLVVSPPLRSWLARWLRTISRSLHVLAYNEIPDNVQVKVVAAVGREG